MLAVCSPLQPFCSLMQVAFAVMLNSAFPWHDFIMEQQDKPVLENVREMLSVRYVNQRVVRLLSDAARLLYTLGSFCNAPSRNGSDIRT